MSKSRMVECNLETQHRHFERQPRGCNDILSLRLIALLRPGGRVTPTRVFMDMYVLCEFVEFLCFTVRHVVHEKPSSLGSPRTRLHGPVQDSKHPASGQILDRRRNPF